MRSKTRGAAIGRPALRLAVERGRPPVEQQQSIARLEQRRPAERGVEQLRRRAEGLAEIQRLAEADEQIDLIARLRARRPARRRAPRAPRSDLRHLHAADSVRGARGPRPAPPHRPIGVPARDRRGVDRALEVAGVVERAGLGQRRRLVRPRRRDQTPVRINAHDDDAAGTHSRIRSAFPYNLKSMGEPVIVAASRAFALPIADRSRRAQGAVPAAPEQLRRLSRRRQRARPAARPPAEGLRHRHVGAPLPGQAAVPELLDHRPPVPARARPVRHQDDRGRHVPAAGDGRGTGRRRGAGDRSRARRRRGRASHDGPIGSSTATTRSARPRRTRSGATSRSTRSSTTSRRSRSSTTPAASRTCGRASSAASATRRSASRRIRSGCCARSRWPRGSASRSTRRSTRPSRRTAREIARSAPARLIEEFYKLLRSGASEQAFRMLAERRLLEPIAHELQTGRRRTPVASRWPRSTPIGSASTSIPDTLTNAILLGSLLVPLGMHAVTRAGRAGRRPREGAATLARDAAAGAPRRRTAAPDPRPAAAADRHEAVAARAARADAPRAVPRGADVAGDSRAGAGGGRALARVHRSRRRVTKARRETATAAPAPPPPAPTTAPRRRASFRPTPARRSLAVRALELAHELHERVDAFFGKRVVDRRAHAADRAVALEAVEARGGRLPSRTASPAPRSAGGT